MQVIQKIVGSFANGKAALIAAIKNTSAGGKSFQLQLGDSSVSSGGIDGSYKLPLPSCHQAPESGRSSSILRHSTRNCRSSLIANVLSLKQYKRVNKLPIFCPSAQTKMVHAVETREHRE